MKQSEKFGAEFKYTSVQDIDTSSRPFKVKTNEGFFFGKTVIVSTGARPKKLDIPSETKYWGKGVTSCATCDGYFFKGQDVIVIGGGDSAMEEATFLTRFSPKVYLIHRRDKFRASKIMAEKTLKNPNIEVIWNSVVEEILGDGKKVDGVLIKNVETNQTQRMNIKGVFLGIGHIPNTDPFKGKLNMDENGYLLTKSNSTETNVEGIFACGDCQDHVYRQAITAAGTGCMAALEAEKFLENHSE